MTEQLQLRGGTNAENNAFTGAPREVTVDTTFSQLRLHNGVTQGGTIIGGALGMQFQGEVGPGDWNSIAPADPEVGQAWLCEGEITNFPDAPPNPITGDLLVYSTDGWINIGGEVIGPPGPEGPPGPAGDSSTITVGATATLPAGSDATVVNSGTASAAVLDFGIPKGDTGAQGPPGNAGDSVLDFKGEVATVSALPTSGNQNGDAYYVTDVDKYYVWNGTEWVTTSGGSGSLQDLDSVLEEGNSAPDKTMDVQSVLADSYVARPPAAGPSGQTVDISGDSTWAVSVIDPTNQQAEQNRAAGFKWNGDVFAGNAEFYEHLICQETLRVDGLSTLNDVNIPTNRDIGWSDNVLRMYTYDGSNNPGANRNNFACYAEVKQGRDYYVTLDNSAGVGNNNEVNFGVWTWDASDPNKIYANMGGAGTLLNINKNTQKTYIKTYDLETLPPLP